MIGAATFSGLQLQSAYAITSASFDNIEITNAGTDGMFLSSGLSGDASFSNITVIDSARSNFLNYSPKLKFTINFGKGNVGRQFP